MSLLVKGEVQIPAQGSIEVSLLLIQLHAPVPEAMTLNANSLNQL